jgi:micrococcal nuclease
MRRGAISAALVVLALGFAVSQAAAAGLPARVVKVTDGDTLHVVLSDDSYHVCRLIGIDAPEQAWGDDGSVLSRGQPLGRAATDYLSYLVRESMRVALHGKDVYNRSLCWLEGPAGSINGEMVRAGFAEVYRGPGENPYRRELEAFEDEARLAGRGIWRLPNYESPREFRRKSTRGGTAR